jgi:hypothetical protein
MKKIKASLGKIRAESDRPETPEEGLESLIKRIVDRKDQPDRGPEKPAETARTGSRPREPSPKKTGRETRTVRKASPEKKEPAPTGAPAQLPDRSRKMAESGERESPEDEDDLLELEDLADIEAMDAVIKSLKKHTPSKRKKAGEAKKADVLRYFEVAESTAGPGEKPAEKEAVPPAKLRKEKKADRPVAAKEPPAETEAVGASAEVVDEDEFGFAAGIFEERKYPVTVMREEAEEEGKITVPAPDLVPPREEAMELPGDVPAIPSAAEKLMESKEEEKAAADVETEKGASAIPFHPLGQEWEEASDFSAGLLKPFRPDVEEDRSQEAALKAATEPQEFPESPAEDREQAVAEEKPGEGPPSEATAEGGAQEEIEVETIARGPSGVESDAATVEETGRASGKRGGKETPKQKLKKDMKKEKEAEGEERKDEQKAKKPRKRRRRTTKKPADKGENVKKDDAEKPSGSGDEGGSTSENQQKSGQTGETGEKKG